MRGVPVSVSQYSAGPDSVWVLYPGNCQCLCHRISQGFEKKGSNTETIRCKLVTNVLLFLDRRVEEPFQSLASRRNERKASWYWVLLAWYW